MIIDCPYCRNPFQTPDGTRSRPCPHCGYDVEPQAWVGVPTAAPRGSNRRAAAVAFPISDSSQIRRGSSPQDSGGSARSTSARFAATLPEWFQCRPQTRSWWGGRANVMRAYVTLSDMILVDMGVKELSRNREASKGAAWNGERAPALFPAIAAREKQELLDKLLGALERSTLEQLRAFVAVQKSCMVLSMKEIGAPRIESVNAAKGGPAAVLRFHRVGRGPMAFELLEPVDVAIATAAFSRHFSAFSADVPCGVAS